MGAQVQGATGVVGVCLEEGWSSPCRWQVSQESHAGGSMPHSSPLYNQWYESIGQKVPEQNQYIFWYRSYRAP